MQAGPGGRGGKARRPPGPASRHYHHSDHTQVRSGRELPSSKLRKLGQKKGAAGGSRKEHNRRGEKHSSRHPGDFGGREPRRAMWKSWMERRTSVNRSPCGRRTSLGSAAEPPASALSIRVSFSRGKVPEAFGTAPGCIRQQNYLCFHSEPALVLAGLRQTFIAAGFSPNRHRVQPKRGPKTVPLKLLLPVRARRPRLRTAARLRISPAAV